jgi:hypothetical protein
VPRYDGETNPIVWLEDYRLACHTGGATDNLFVIKNLPLYLGDSARTWLEHLPRDKIHDRTDLRRIFVGKFQGTYTRPDKQWELRNCKQQPGASLREYIRCFFKRCTELPGATDNDAISVFQNGTTCTSLIHRLGRRMPRTTRELLDIASNHADGEEVVAATLNTPQSKGKQVVDHGEGTSSRFKKTKKNDKRRRDDNLIAAVERKTSRPKGNPTKPAPTRDHFERLPDHVPQPGSYPLVVAPLFKSRRIHKVLMDGGSGINVLYASMLDEMGIPRSALRPSTGPFHGVVLEIKALPLGQIDLPVTFGDMRNFRT